MSCLLEIEDSLSERSEEGMKFRREHLGGSDIGIILGVSPYKTRYVLWLEKLNKIKPDELNEAMLRGIALESTARDKYIETTGIAVSPKRFYYSKWNILTGSFDGISMDYKVGYEAKCPTNRKLYDQALIDKFIPEYYYAQIQTYLLISEADVWDYHVYLNDNEHVILNIYPDYKYQENIVVKAKEFWQMVQTRTPPKKVEGDPEMVFDENINILSQEWEEIKRIIKEKEEKLEEKEKEIKEYVKDINSKSILFDKSSLKISKFTKTGNVDWTKLSTDLNISEDIKNNYRKENTDIISFRL